MAHEKTQKRVGKRPGRKPSKIDQKAKLERSRQSARECRARKKLRYQYLEELVNSREKAVFSLREEVEMYKRWCLDLDRGIVPDGLLKMLAQEEMGQAVAPKTPSPSATSTPSTTPSASPSPSEPSPGVQIGVRPLSVQQTGVQQSRLAGSQPGQLVRQQIGVQQSRLAGSQPGQMGRQQMGPQPPQGASSVGISQAQAAGQHHAPPRQGLVRQPSLHQAPQLTSMNRGTRSFEESSLSSSSSMSMFRSGSVPNLTVSAPQSNPDSSSSSFTTLVYRDFSTEDNSSLGSTGFIPLLSETSCAGGNIPTVVCNQSPPAGAGRPSGAWTVGSSKAQFHGAGVSHMTSVPVCSVGSVSRTVASSASHTKTRVFSDTLVTARQGVNVTSAEPSSSAGIMSSSAVPYYQRPRSSSDLARRVTSSATVLPSSSTSVSQQSLQDVLDTSVTCYASPDIFSTLTLSDSVASGLTSSPAPHRVAPVCAGTQLPVDSSALQGLAPVCVGSELSASISEPIPHWYSFLDDLESATLSARQGAFSDAGTPSSSRGRSGAGTPSSVDSPYSQQQQQQQAGGTTDGNIPNIITDLLGQLPPS